jgi:TRAP-type C4-dicarboxylate transport system permease small subunit
LNASTPSDPVGSQKRRPAGKLQRGAELFCAALFAAMFCAFILQIFARYVLNSPISWTQEICTLLYVWIVCVGSAAILHEREHVTFDLIYQSVSPYTRRILAIVGTGFAAIVFLAALPGNLDYLAFMQSQRTPTLRLPMTVVMAAFCIFLVLAIVRGGIRLYRLLGAGWQAED